MKDVIEGIVVSEVSYSETSKIINILTPTGIIGCMAKGAKGLKSNLRVGTTKITYGKFYISKKEEKLSILTGVDIINDFKNIKKDIVKISYATYIVDLASQVMKHNVDSNVFNILLSALIKINENFSPVIITNILELKYLEYLGVMPIIDECAICGSKTSIATLSSSRGGLIVSDKTIKLIRMFYYVDISKISSLDISNKSILEISNFLDDYYDRYTGLYLKSKKLLKNINKVS